MPWWEGKYTQDEILRYASYHWLQIEREDEKPDAHVWCSIGGECHYLGLADEYVFDGREPPEQRPMYPSLVPPEDATHFGNMSGAGGVLDKVEREEVA